MADIKALEAAKRDETAAKAVVSNPHLIKLSRTYEGFDGPVDTIDLSGLEHITAKDMIEVSKVSATAEVNANPMATEYGLMYNLCIAQRVTGLPMQFFELLRPKDALRIRTHIVNFFADTD